MKTIESKTTKLLSNPLAVIFLFAILCVLGYIFIPPHIVEYIIIFELMFLVILCLIAMSLICRSLIQL